MVTGNATHQVAVMAVMASGNGGPLTLDQLDAVLPIGRKQIATAAAKLIQRSFVERRETGVYALTVAGRQALSDGAEIKSGPHRGQRKHRFVADSLQQRAWSAMRLTKRFALSDLLTLAATERDGRPRATLLKFIERLARAGYVAELPERRPGNAPTSNGFKQWRLVRDTGAASPRWLDRQQAFKDWNTREVFPCV